MAKQDITTVELEFPENPKFKISEDQTAFDRWYEQFKTCIRRQFERHAAAIDAVKNKT